MLGAASGLGQPPAATPPPLEPFKQEISGTLVAIDLVPIPRGAVDVPDPDRPGAMKQIDVGPFWVSATEITWDAYDIFVYRLDVPEGEAGGEGEPPADGPDAITRPSKPYIPPDRGYGHAGYAAISLSFKGAEEFCKWLSAKTGRTYRLPTEIEWEYLARADAAADASYCFGDDASLIDDYAWHTGNAKRKTQPVGKKKANAWGVFDVHGNVAEWCVGRDGQPIACGGAFLNKPEEITLKRRDKQTALWNITDPQMPKSTWWLSDCNFVGFRVVCESEAQEPVEESERP